ncbi:neuropeptide CCHamide-2 receptor-like [Periplaneta americana]|uniref:neuropeptide CCHamide-2 receptor-like n=1 Tax=Periplaneta americana TaxID=6978 RepID=UPI0037E70EAA
MVASFLRTNTYPLLQYYVLVFYAAVPFASSEMDLPGSNDTNTEGSDKGFNEISLQENSCPIFENNTVYDVQDFQRYVESLITIVIVCGGLTLDGTLLLIFIRHKEMRIIPNIMVMNIAINDLLVMIVVVPIQYFTVSDVFNLSQIFWSCLPVFSYASALCILAMGALRFHAISGMKNNSVTREKYFKCTHILQFMLMVWSTVIGIGNLLLVMYFVSGSEAVKTAKLCILMFIAFLAVVLLPLNVTGFNMLLSRKLKQSARNMPGEGSHDNLVRSRYRSSRVLIALAATFWLTHTPLFIWILLLYVRGLCLLPRTVGKYMFTAVCCMFYSNSIINPLALYISSEKFRNLFNKYLFRCWYSEQKEEKQENAIKVGRLRQ